MITGLFLSASIASAFVPPPEAKMKELVEAPWRKELPERIVDVTDPFVDAPYVLSPLGEGDGIDPDPRFRVDAFDCTTFVETALALSLGTSLDDSKAILDALRYQHGKVGYETRRHFPEAEWIPDLVQAGILEDITRELGGSAVTVEKKELNASVWAKAKKEKLPQLSQERIPNGVYSLDVWALDDVTLHADKIPPGTLVHLVRTDFKNVPVRVSHQGLIIEKGGKRYIRHAADRMHHRVVDEPLATWLGRMKKYGKWPVTGLHLTRVKPKADWRVRLGLVAAATAAK